MNDYLEAERDKIAAAVAKRVRLLAADLAISLGLMVKVVCPHCGAPADRAADFVFCRQCSAFIDTTTGENLGQSS